MAKYGEMLGESPLSMFGDVLDRYLRSEVPKKAPATQRDNVHEMKSIRAVFGRMTPARIEPVHVYEFRDKLATKSGPTQANLHLALLKHIFVKAIEWGAIKTHPARDVRKIPVIARDRYVEDWEFSLVYGLAPETLQVAMDLAVLTGLRRGDLLALTRSQVRDDGIHVTLAKVGQTFTEENHYRMVGRAPGRDRESEKDQAAAEEIYRRHQEAGSPLRKRIDTAWDRAMMKAEKAGLEIGLTSTIRARASYRRRRHHGKLGISGTRRRRSRSVFIDASRPKSGRCDTEFPMNRAISRATYNR